MLKSRRRGGKPESSLERKLTQQVAFLADSGALRDVLRTAPLPAGRCENSAEHTWHVCLVAMVMEKYANEPVLIGRVLELLVVHDLVEVYAGDTDVFDDAGKKTKRMREAKAAKRLFEQLPPAQRTYFHQLVKEYDDAATPESRFARACDRFQGIVTHCDAAGQFWKRHGIKLTQVLALCAKIRAGSDTMWRTAVQRVEQTF